MNANALAFLVWFGASAALVGILVCMNLYAQWRSLIAQDVPQPWLVTWRNSFARLLPTRSLSIPNLVGRRALVCWDIRWVAAERTIAHVTSVNTDSEELGLRLTNPIHLTAIGSAPEVHLENVRFCPRKARSLRKIESRAVSGRLHPPLSEGLYATASIVVYPEGA
jgi:hypothetical protein